MHELLKEAEELRGQKEPSPARVFLEIKYPEMKDLLKHFLTLISGSLVFSVAFSEKIVNFETATVLQRLVVLFGWTCLILAFISCGLSIYMLYISAEKATANVVYGDKHNFGRPAKLSYRYQDLSGVLFGLGLILLVVATLLKL